MSDSTGRPVAGAPVRFTLPSNPGGEASITAEARTTNSEGRITAHLTITTAGPNGQATLTLSPGGAQSSAKNVRVEKLAGGGARAVLVP